MISQQNENNLKSIFKHNRNGISRNYGMFSDNIEDLF